MNMDGVLIQPRCVFCTGLSAHLLQTYLGSPTKMFLGLLKACVNIKGC